MGLGAIAPNGVGMTAYIRGLREGKSGVRPLGFADPRMKSTVAAACVDFDPTTVLPEAELARLPRLVPMALAAAREALRAAGLLAEDAARLAETHAPHTAVVLGTGGGGIDFTLAQADAVHHGGRASLWTITNATHGNLAGELSIQIGANGPSMCITTGCASSSDAVGVAMDLLRSERPGAPRIAVVVGADAHIRWETLASMELLKVISIRDWRAEPEGPAAASRPFDEQRDGFVLGEGAWAMVLEREDHARGRERGAVGSMLGYAATCDAFHRVRPMPDMRESVRAMELALQDAGLTPRDIDAVQYHGTGTQLNDVLESAAVKRAFGEYAAGLRGGSVKSMIGHPQGASGMAALVGLAGALLGADGGAPFLPPTINIGKQDARCDIDVTPNKAAATGARTFLVNCLAFGAKNSVLVGRVNRP